MDRPARPRTRRFAMARTIAALILREMSSTYGRSPGGYVWAVVEPVAAIALLTLLFSLFLRQPSLGTSFPLFYATGYLTFQLYQQTQAKMGAAIRFSRALLAYPAVTFVDALLARFILNLLTNIMVMYLIFGGIVLFTETRARIDFLPIIEAVLLMAMVGFGVGTINCYLMNAFPLWEQAWTVISRPIFLVSGVFFLYEEMPEIARDILWWNPIMHGVAIMRTGFYPTYHPAWVSQAYPFYFALMTTAIGLMLLRRHHRNLLQN